jgi:hypothetical protein
MNGRKEAQKAQKGFDEAAPHLAIFVLFVF